MCRQGLQYFVSGDIGVSGTPKWLTKFNFIKDRLFLAGKQQNLLGTPKKLSVPGIPNINSGLVRKRKLQVEINRLSWLPRFS